jgi:hypothetical protein
MPLLQSSRKPTDPAIQELEKACASIEEQARECEQILREAPQRMAAEKAERDSTIPPPDDLADRRRELRFYELVSRGQLRNERRAQAGSIVLLLLLVAATSALVMWVLQLTG